MSKEFKWTSIDTRPNKTGHYLIYRTTGVLKVAKYSEINGFSESWDKILAWSEIPEVPSEFTNAQQMIASLRNENRDLEVQNMKLIQLIRRIGNSELIKEVNNE